MKKSGVCNGEGGRVTEPVWGGCCMEVGSPHCSRYMVQSLLLGLHINLLRILLAEAIKNNNVSSGNTARVHGEPIDVYSHLNSKKFMGTTSHSIIIYVVENAVIWFEIYITLTV